VSKPVNPLVLKLFAAFRERRKSVPDFEAETGIPRDRVYSWKKAGTTPKAEDQRIINTWLDGSPGNVGKHPKNVAAEINDTQSVLPVNLIETLMTKLISVTDTTNRILERQEKSIVEKVDRIDTNLVEQGQRLEESLLRTYGLAGESRQVVEKIQKRINEIAPEGTGTLYDVVQQAIRNMDSGGGKGKSNKR
jgi:hypothetical protein